MSERVETRGVLLDFNKLAGKGRQVEVRSVNKIKNSEMSVEEKYTIQTVKSSKKRGEETHKTQSCKDRNVFENVVISSKFKNSTKSKMVAMDANNSDSEIILQKTVQNQYLGKIHDNKVDSMMLVMFQLEYDGTRSKLTGNHVACTPDIGGDRDAIHGKNSNKIPL